MNRKLTAGFALALICLTVTGALQAHHSLARYDTTAPLWIKGTVVEFARVNPHSLIFLDERRENGEVRRWAVDGPDAGRLVSMGIGPDSLQPGDVIEVCGFATRDGALSQRAAPPPSGAEPAARSPRGQVLNGTLLVLASGEKRIWSDYGHLRQCISDEEGEALRLRR